MKLEILKDNKTTNARVGSIMIVSNHMGAQWVEKGLRPALKYGVEMRTNISALKCTMCILVGKK